MGDETNTYAIRTDGTLEALDVIRLFARAHNCNDRVPWEGKSLRKPPAFVKKCPSALSGLRSLICQITMNELNTHGTFTYRRSYSLDAFGSNVSYRKHSWHICLQGIGSTLKISICKYARPRLYESLGVQGQAAADPASVRICPGHHE
jgi:hypothetical protein